MVSMAKAKRSFAQRLAGWRIWVQAAFLLAWLDPLMMRMHGVCSPVFHCYSCPLATFACPIGVLANFSAIHLVPFYAIGTLLIVGAVLGSFVCGWICPFGFFQDLLGRIPTPKLTLPAWLGLTRYAVLIGLVGAIPYWYGAGDALFICRLCPAGALEGAVPNVVRQAVAGQAIDWPSTAKLAILGVLLVTALFTWRPWCTLFCPLGAMYGLLNHVSLVYVGFQPKQCTDCDLCRGQCHYRGHGQRRAGESRCIRCLECVGCKALAVGTIADGPGRLLRIQPDAKAAAKARGPAEP
jgi:ferredoxin-type protein NapH